MMKFILSFLAAFYWLSIPVSYAGLVDDCASMRLGDHCKFAILDLEPTQQFIGKKVALLKRDMLEELSKDERRDYLRDNPIPVIKGPDGKYHMVDHHHLSYGARLAGRDNVYIKLLHDWSKMSSMNVFWEKMKAKKLVFLFDANGKPIPVSALPGSVMRMEDNPFRSLAYFVREKGGYRKTKIPFAEMYWALFFQANMKIDPAPWGFEKAIEEAYDLARSDKAVGLPGKIKGGMKYCRRFLEGSKEQ